VNADKITLYFTAFGIGIYIVAQISTILGRELPPGKVASFFQRFGHDAKEMNQDIAKIVPGRIPVVSSDPQSHDPTSPAQQDLTGAACATPACGQESKSANANASAKAQGGDEKKA